MPGGVSTRDGADANTRAPVGMESADHVKPNHDKQGKEQKSSPFSPLPGSHPDPEDPTFNLPDPGPGKSYTSFPWNNEWLAEPSYYDALGRDPIMQMRVYTLPDEDEHVQHVLRIADLFPNHGLDIMFGAVKRDKAKVVNALIKAGVPTHPTPGSRESHLGLFPIHVAAFRGQLDIVRALVEEGKVDPEDDSQGRTALMRAAMKGHKPVMQWLLETAGVDPARRIRQGNYETSALIFAALCGDVGCIELIVEFMKLRGIPIKEQMDEEVMANAGASGNRAMVTRCMSWADLPELDVAKSTEVQLDEKSTRLVIKAWVGALGTAHATLAEELFEYMQSRSSDLSLHLQGILENLQNGIIIAARKNDKEAFERFLSRFRSIEKDQTLITKTLGEALSEACYVSALDIAKDLIQNYSVDVDDGSNNARGVTPLIAAAYSGHLALVEYLVDEAGANVCVEDGQGHKTALWYAAKEKKKDVVLSLLQRGGPVSEIVPPQKPDFSKPQDIFVQVFSLQDTDSRVKLVLDRDVATRYMSEHVGYHVIGIDGLTCEAEVWWDKLIIGCLGSIS